MVRFFNVRKIKGSNYSVPRNGSFAMLYRITIGINPTRKFSKAQQLMKHFIGEIFICTYEHAQGISSAYFRVTKIVPVAPQYSESWLGDGRLVKRRIAPRKVGSQIYTKDSINKKHTGNDLETDGQLSGNQLETRNADNPQHTLPEGAIASHKDIQHTRVDAYKHASDHQKYMSVEVRNSSGSRERIIRYWQMPGETYEQYLDRVIETSLDEDYLLQQETI